MIHNHWLSIIHHDSQPLTQHHNPWFTATGSTYHTMIHNLWLSIIHRCESWYAMLSPVFVNHGLLCWASGCESWFIMLSQIHNHWLRITQLDSRPLAQNNTPWFTTTELTIAHHDSQPLAQNNISWFTTTSCVILSQWLWIMVSYAEPVVVHNTPWFITTGSA
jgi:hypothetical protein